MNNYSASMAESILKKVKMPESQIKSVIKNSKYIFDKIPNQKNKINKSVGLIVGKVQSGKTSTMIASSAIAFENGCRVVIALLSNYEPILAQNYSRMEKAFAEYEDKIKVRLCADKGNFTTTLGSLNYLYETGCNLLICTLKNKSRINQIIKGLKNSPYANEYTVVFDDEGDYASMNTKKDKFNKINGLYVENKFTSTNEAIKELKNNFRKIGYVLVTATPQSIIMLQDFQHLAADFVKTTTPGVGYCGLEYYHVENHDKLIKKIDSNDIDKLVNENGIPLGLKNAFYFFIAGAIYRTKNETDFKHSMMIHASKIIIDHQRIYEKMNLFKKQLESSFLRNRQSSSVYLESINRCLKEITDKNITISNKDIINFFNGLKITSLNSESQINEIEMIQADNPYHLIIGGDLLNRGVTINGLAVSYILRDSKIGQVDTLVQRGRWFGYKYNYIETCRVYMTKHLDAEFIEAAHIDNYIWDTLVECSEADIAPKNFDFEFCYDNKLVSLTSKKKALFEDRISSIKTSQRYIPINQKYNDSNFDIIKKIFDLHKAKNVKYGPQTHNLISIKINELFDYVKEYYFSKDSSKCNFDMFSKTLKMLGYKGNDYIDILLIQRKGEKEERSTIADSNQIVGLLQGHSPNRLPDDVNYYPGDAYLCGVNPMLQFHIVKLKNDVKINGDIINLNKGSIVPMVAWMFPKESYKRLVIKRTELN